MPSIFANVYNEGPGIQGLHYIALGIGLAICSQMNAQFMDKIYIYFKRKNGNVGEPEFRLPTMVPATLMVPIGLFMSGWASQTKVHWIVTDIVRLELNPRITLILTVLFTLQGIALVGGGMILVFQCIQTYVVDAFTLHAASGTYPVSTPFLRLNADDAFRLSSSGSRIMFARPRCVRLPSFCHPNVQ